MRQSELRNIIREEITKYKILEENNQKASKINKDLLGLIEKIKKDFNIEDERF